MLIINEEENKKLNKRDVIVPKYIRKLAMKVRNEYPSKQAVGYKRLSHILDSDYNKFKSKKGIKVSDAFDNDPNKVVKMPATTAKQIASALKSPGAIADNEAQQTIKSWAKNAVQAQRNQVKPVNTVKRPPKLAKPNPHQNLKDTQNNGKLTGKQLS